MCGNHAFLLVPGGCPPTLNQYSPCPGTHIFSVSLGADPDQFHHFWEVYNYRRPPPRQHETCCLGSKEVCPLLSDPRRKSGSSTLMCYFSTCREGFFLGGGGLMQNRDPKIPLETCERARKALDSPRLRCLEKYTYGVPIPGSGQEAERRAEWWARASPLCCYFLPQFGLCSCTVRGSFGGPGRPT